jgi:hypothetical protein
MTAAQGNEHARRVQRALLAYLRQEFTAPAAAIVGYVDILIEDAKRLSLNGYLSDLERIHSAGHSLHSLLQSVLAHEHSDGSVIFDPSKLRHDLRTPINAIKGYGEMLVEDAASDGHEVLLADLGKLLTAADGVLKLIDALVDFRAESAEGAGSKPIAGMGGVVEAVRVRPDAAAGAHRIQRGEQDPARPREGDGGGTAPREGPVRGLAAVHPAALDRRAHQRRGDDDRRPRRRSKHSVCRHRRLHPDGQPPNGERPRAIPQFHLHGL